MNLSCLLNLLWIVTSVGWLLLVVLPGTIVAWRLCYLELVAFGCDLLAAFWWVTVLL